jgi:DHA3 family macrolide efflux protein-like MFS transporter
MDHGITEAPGEASGPGSAPVGEGAAAAPAGPVTPHVGPEAPRAAGGPGPAAAGTRPRLWTASFALLWQGQLVSTIGDTVYEIALGFWILAVTGSTGLMGALMAASTIPRVLLTPLAGVWVDRGNRKALLVGMDALRGVVVVLVAAAALSGHIQVWMVFAAGVVIGLGAAVFNPTIMAIIPDIVHRERIVQGNSFFSMIRAASGILGNSLGGVLYALLGAPLMFLANGISYLFSAATELFIRVPKVERAGAPPHFFADLKAGFRYVWQSGGLRSLLLVAAVLNFFAMVGIVLILPLFQRTEALGPVRFGVVMAVFTGAMLLGMAFTAAVRIPDNRRYGVFISGMAVSSVAFALFPVWEIFPLMLAFAVVGGFSNAIVNVLIQSLIQLSTPQEMRGKVMGLLEALTGGLVPIGMALGGLLGEFLPLRLVIFLAFALAGVVGIPPLLAPSIREFFGGRNQA